MPDVPHHRGEPELMIPAIERPKVIDVRPYRLFQKQPIRLVFLAVFCTKGVAEKPQFIFDGPAGDEPEPAGLGAPIIGERPFQYRCADAGRILLLLLASTKHRDGPELVRLIAFDLNELDLLAYLPLPDQRDVVL